MRYFNRPVLHATLVVALLTVAACGPSARERQAEALLISAKEKEASPGSDSFYTAFSLYQGIVRDYADTDAAKRASERITAIGPTVKAMKAMDESAARLEDQINRQRVLNAAWGR